MKSENTRPGEEKHLYVDMKCCIHPCSVRECPEARCIEDFPDRRFTEWCGSESRYLETLRVFQECQNIKETAKVLNIDPSNVRKRLKWIKSLTQ